MNFSTSGTAGMLEPEVSKGKIWPMRGLLTLSPEPDEPPVTPMLVAISGYEAESTVTKVKYSA